MKTNKIQWRRIAEGEELPCDSLLMRYDGTITRVGTCAGVKAGQDAYYLPVEELRTLPKEESEDKKMIQYFEDLAPFHEAEELYEKYGFSHKEAIAWLKKQGKQESVTCPICGWKSEKQGEQKPWSEEDEKMLNDIIKDLVHPWNEYIPDRIEDEIKWLKNKLKSLSPQNSWRPSEGQMDDLESAVSLLQSTALESLYQKLNELM